jgi:hypothetical protein
MNKFDNIISTKMGQLNEVAVAGAAQAATTATPGAAQPTAQPASQAAAQSQTAQPAPVSTEDALTKAFQTLKFSDANTAVKALNTAYKGAGNVPGIKEFFGQLAFDPQKGFLVQQAQSAQAAPAVAPAATPGAPALK